VHAVQGDVGARALGLAEFVGSEGDPDVVVAAADGLGEEREPGDLDVRRARQAALLRQFARDPVLGHPDGEAVRDHGEPEQQQQDDQQGPHRQSTLCKARATGPQAASGSTPWISESAHHGGGCSPSGGSVAAASTTR
jgi:hypothetical protein